MRKNRSMKFIRSFWAASTSVMVLSSAIAQEAPAQRPDTAQERTVLHNDPGICGGVILVPVQGKEEPVQPGGEFAIVPTFGAGVTNARRVVIQQAINEWQAIIETAGVNPNNYDIDFAYEPLGGPLAVAFVFFSEETGDLAFARIRIDPGFRWFEDPTPGDDSEFDPFGPPGFDLLSVVRHEIGHAVGWVGTSRYTVFLSGCDFDPGRLNIAVTDCNTRSCRNGTHADPAVHVGDLMIPCIPESVRRSITLYPDAALTARAFAYTIPMRFGDPDNNGAETGSASFPWNTMAEGFQQTPPGIPILLASGTYNEPGPITRSTPTTLTPARGANATIAPP